LRKCCLGQSEKSKIPYHLIKFVSDLLQVGGFRHNIAEILLKVAFITIKQIHLIEVHHLQNKINWG
jgi:hypothetical protein